MKTLKAKSTAFESRRRAFYKLVEAPDTEPMELIRASLRAASGGEETIAARERESYQSHEAEYCLKNRKDVAKIYENPLDDDERLEEVRRLVFGIPPERPLPE